MPYRVIQAFDTGTKKIKITLEENVDSYEKVIRVSDIAGYFTMFDADASDTGWLSASFLASTIKAVFRKQQGKKRNIRKILTEEFLKKQRGGP